MSFIHLDICRLCGTKSRRLMTVELELADQINFLFHIQMNEEAVLTRAICRNCVSSVASCWTFYQQILRVQQQLIQIKKEPPIEEPHPINNDNTSSSDYVGRPRSKKVESKRVKHDENDGDRSSKLAEAKISASLVEKTPLDPSLGWPDYPWGCNICGESLADEQYYRTHPCFTMHKRYFCADCPKAFKLYEKMISHIKDQHWNRLKAHLLLQCDVCELWFRSKEEQEFHREQEHSDAETRIEPEMPAHMAKQSFDCHECGKSFANKAHLKQHEKVHSEEKPFICDVCGKGFRQPSGLVYHIKRHHTATEQQFHCDQCGKICPIKLDLEAHMITHATERPFVCEICQKAFKTQSTLDLHRSRHTDTRKYVCKTCGKSYKILKDLQVHTRIIHTVGRIHKCSFCEKAFKTRPNVISHERQHTGEQPYSCTVCQRKFACVGNRLKHMRRIHKICLRETDIYANKEEQMREKMTDVKIESSSCKTTNVSDS